MIKIIEQEISFDDSLKKKLEFICDFCNTTPKFINGSIRKIDNTNLELDLSTMENNPNAKFSKEDMNKFFNFFSNIKVTDSNNINQCAKEIAKELENRKISFKDNKNIYNKWIHSR